MQKQIFINKFQKGVQQNSNLGNGAIVGFDAYTKQGAVILGKKIVSTYQFGTLGEYATYMAISNSSNGTPSLAISSRIWAQTAMGTVYYSDTYGASFTQVVIGGAPPAAHGNGLIIYENYVFVFFDDEIWYATANAASPSFTKWKTGVQNGTQQSTTSPISSNHYPYLFPNNRGVYFANNNAVGFFGQVFPVGATTPTVFNPGGTLGTDYLYTNIILNLPDNYSVNVLDFLPPSNLAIGANNISSGQEADIMTWDTISANKFSAPIKIYSGTNINGAQGVKQMVNRQNVVYAAVGGNHAMYATNGGTVNIISDTSLYSDIRDGSLNSNGKEYPLPVFFNSFPQAIAVAGNKILSGVSTSANNSYYPAADTGVFPTGIWSTYFNNDGSTMQQMEYSIPFFPGGTIGSLSTFAITGDIAGVTSILPLANGQIAVGYIVKFGGGGGIGSIAVFDTTAYIQDITLTSLESELFEIGTAINPQVVTNIEINLIKNLLTGQQVEVSYRKFTDAEWEVIATFTGDGTKNYYSIQEQDIGATQYVQFRIRACTNSGNPNDTPQLRTVIIS